MTPDYYAILGVTRASEDVVIRAAYRALMRRYHPDSNGTDETAATARAINEAYAVLSDPEKRARYDGSRAAEGLIRPSLPERRSPGSIPRPGPVVVATVGAVALALTSAVLWSPLPSEQARPARPLAVEQMRSAAATVPDTGSVCGAHAANGLIRDELFRRAARLRGSDAGEFRSVARYALVRIASPAAKEHRRTGSVDCRGWVAVDLPPGVTVEEGRTNLNVELGYSLAAASSGELRLSGLADADGIIRSLATLARAPQELDERAPATRSAALSGSEVASATPERMRGREVPERTTSPAKVAAATKSSATKITAKSNCNSRVGRAERALCGNARLAELDRHLTLFYTQSFGKADADTRAALVSTRERFRARRDACHSDSCLTSAYVARMREVSEIMAEREQQ